MKKVAVTNFSRPLNRPIFAKYCASFFCQLRGLTFRRSLAADEGLLLAQKHANRIDSAIHMLFVFMPLGIVWINASGTVVDLRLALPWRPIYVPAEPAQYVLEIHPARLIDFCKGDYVRFEEARLA
jgi:uncharacterized membrane protein (UPF0127 family)